MAERKLTPKPIPKTYAELRDAVLAMVLKGRQEIERAWVETYHETGRLICEHLLYKNARAEYGAKTYELLAADSGINKRTLQQWAQFYRRIPIVHRGAQFNWAQFRLFCQVEDDAQRLALMSEAAKKGWTTEHITDRVRALNAAIDIEVVSERSVSAEFTPKPLTPQRGTPSVHRVAKAGEGLVVDLGFACYLDLPAETDFAGGEFVTVDAAGRVSIAPDATKADLFTYRAEVIKVVDGDTLWIKIYLRPRQWLKQKLRLRGLDCPELNTLEGKTAKRFVDALLAPATAIIIHTTKPDKYDRYLADVFIATPGQAEPVFLNNALLAGGHAALKTSYVPSDWDDFFR